MTYYITHSGGKIDIRNISPSDIKIKDIAHHLTKICRYGGALDLDIHYSVAAHSIQLANYAKKQGLNTRMQRALLMHDATEAYLGDVVSGLKCYLAEYRGIELRFWRIIKEKYDLYESDVVDTIVKNYDTRILLDEAKAFAPHHYDLFKNQLKDKDPLGIDIVPDSNLKETYYLFLYWCDKLGIKD